MKKNKILKLGVITSIVLLTISCTLTPELAEPQTTPTIERMDNTYGGPVFSVPITLDRVKIFTSGSATVSGTVTVEIATSNGTTILGSSVLPGSSMTGTAKWRTFYFAPVILQAGTKYRIQVKRSDAPNYTNNFIHWGASDGAIDAYPGGETSITGTHPPYDMAFITYSDGYVDQQQTAYRYFWGIGTHVSWQEFIPKKIWTNHP